MPPKTSFGYVEREADSYVNWADVGRTITNTVDEIDRVRTEKKAAIDAAYKEELERINNKPIGQKDDVNKWTIDMAYNAAENLKIQHNLLKSGKLAVKDYAIYLQNTSDSIKNLYGTIGQIQTAFQERLDRQAKGENQDIEMWDGQDLEQYGKLTDLGANFNINGNLTFSRLETVTEDGKTITRAKPGSENLLSVNQLSGAVSTKYNKYDYLTDADKFIKRLGEGITAYRITGSELQAGSITQITDKTGKLDLGKAKDLGFSPEEIERIQGVVSEYAKAEEEYINAALNPKYNKSSLLTEELGYKTTDNVEEAKKNPTKLMLVQRETDGTITPIIPEGSDQDKAAREFLRGQYRQMIDKKLEISTYTEVGKQKQEPPRPSAAELEVGGRAQSAKSIGSDVGKLYGSDLRTRETALSGFKQYTGVGDLYFSEDSSGNVSIRGYTEHGGIYKEVFVPYMRNGKLVDVQTFGKAFAPVIGKIDLANERFGEFTQALTPYNKYNADWGKGASEEETNKNRSPESWSPKAKSEKEKTVKEVNVGFTSFGLGQEKAANELNKIVNKYGFTVKATGYLGNSVAIYDAVGNKLTGNISTNYGKQADQVKRQEEFNKALNELIKVQGGKGELDEE